MASRRSRLKAVANLPLRRKPLASDQSKDEAKMEEDATSTPKEDRGEVENGTAFASSPPDATPVEARDDATGVEVPGCADPPECKAGKPVGRFGRRIKPSVSLAVLKERPQRTQTCLSDDGFGKENRSVAQDDANDVDSGDSEPRSTDQENSQEIPSNTVQNSNNPLENSVLTPEQEKEVFSPTQCNSDPVKDTHPKNSEKQPGREVVSAEVPNSGTKHAQEVGQTQGSEISPQSTRNVSDSLTSQNSVAQLQQTPKRNSSVTKQKKPKFSDYTRKVADARREFQRKYEKIPPDRSSLRMIDLIFYNPSTNPMESKSKSDKNEVHDQEEDRVDDPDPVDKSPSIANGVDDDDAGNDDFGKMPVPQVKIGLNGEIILDEKSLVIETTDAKKGREDLQNSVPVFEDRSSKTYYYKRKTQKSRDWSDSETKRFYKALNTIGTDFSLMQKYFPIRSRLELKNKFKREEKLNRNLIDKALNNPSEFDITQFEKYLALEHEAEEEEAATKVQRKVKAKRTGSRGRSRSSLLARELAGSDEDNDLLPVNPQEEEEEETAKLKEKTKKSNDINLLCEKYALNGAKGKDAEREAAEAEGCNGSGDGVAPGADAARVESERTNEEPGEKSDAVDEFYDAVASLSAALKSDAAKAKKGRAGRGGGGGGGGGEKRKSVAEAPRKGKKAKTEEYVSTLDIETYDSRQGGDSNSSSGDSNGENGFTSTKTITDQDFMKLLAANAKNMKESKIQLQITEDCSSEKKVEIILDNVPSITLNEIQDQSVTVIASAADGSELYVQQGQETSVIVRNPNARTNSGGSGGGESVGEACDGGKPTSGENENVILVIDENDGGVAKKYEYMMVDGQELEVSPVDKAGKAEGKAPEGSVGAEAEAAPPAPGDIDDLKPGSLPAGSFVLMSTEPEKPLEQRKFSVFMISEKSQADGTSLMSSVPVVLPPELIPSLVKEL